MASLRFTQLLDEERAIPRAAKQAFTPQGLMAMILTRNELVKKIEAAYRDGEITESERDQLVTLDREHSLPPR